MIVPPIKDKGKLLLSRTYRIAPAGPDPEFALAPGTNRAVCLFAKRDLSGSPYCKPFSVHQPFFEPPAPVAAAPSGCAASTNGRAVPYVLKPGLHGECIAIFGVVDPNLREYVGALNDTWVSKPTADGGTEPKLEKQWETDVEVSDPVEALTQLIQFCDVEPACSKARKVLLAHMPRAKAAQIAARFATGEFDAVIAQTDYERASGNLTLTKTVHLDGDGGVDGIAEPIVLVPGAHMKVGDADTLRVRLQQTTIAIYPDHAANQHSELRIAKNTAVAAADERLDPWPAHLTVPALGDPLMTLIEKTAFAAPLRPDPAQPAAPKRSAKMTLLENLALLTMRASCRADAAILQHRDVFLSAAIDRRPLDPAALRLALDMVFWKGDFVVCRTLTGATIKQLLARSAEVAALEANGVVTDLEFGRGLAVLGVKKDLDSGDYVIDGQFIDDKKIYSVATTDFVTEGDTGYAPLQAADPKPPLMGELEHLTRLSALIAQRLGAPQPDVRIDAADYLDASSRAPFDRTGDGVWRQSGRWWVNFLLPNRPIAKATALESSSQQHPLLAISLESLDLKYSDYRHTPHGEKSVNDQFGGAGISELLAPATVDLGYDAQFRVKQSSRWTDLYSFTELHRLRHSEHLLEDPDPATKVTQAANQISQEFGVLVNALPWARRNPSSYKILAAYRRDAVIDDPFQNLKLTDPTNTEKTGPMIYPVPVPKPLTRYAKLGLRHQFRDSALEGGILLGQKLHSVSQFNLSGHRPGGTDPLPCPVDVTRSLQKCADDAMMQTYTGSTTALVDHAQNGYFFNSRIHVPLPLGTTKFLSDQKWQLFRNNDQDVDLDTRYLLRWKLSIELPVFGNLSFAPSWEVLHFRNKQHPRSFNSRRTSLELKYNFDWHSGMGLKALVYPSPAPPQ